LLAGIGKDYLMKRVLSVEEAGDYCGISRGEVYRHLEDLASGFPRPFRYDAGGRPKYDVRDLDEWIDARKAADRARTDAPPAVKARVKQILRDAG